jgi:hypothetical protein
MLQVVAPEQSSHRPLEGWKLALQDQPFDMGNGQAQAVGDSGEGIGWLVSPGLMLPGGGRLQAWRRGLKTRLAPA